jgi:hypothetical protein
MSQPTTNMHRAFLEQVRRDKAALQDKIVDLQAELASLEAVEQYHHARAGIVDDSDLSDVDSGLIEGTPPLAVQESQRLLPGASKHEAAKFMLERIGHPAKIGEVLDGLVRNGYGGELDRRIFFNSLYTALNRREDLFRKVGRGLWALRESKTGANQEGGNSDQET